MLNCREFLDDNWYWKNWESHLPPEQVIVLHLWYSDFNLWFNPGSWSQIKWPFLSTCLTLSSQEGSGAESDGYAGRTLGQNGRWPRGWEKACAREHAFLGGTIEEPLGPNYVFWYIPGVSLESPSIAPRGCCFLTGKRLGEQIFDIGSLWQPLGGYISSGKPSRLLWTSFYGQHLRGWFSSWNASQFLVLPYKLMSTKPVAVCRCFGGWKGEKCRNFHNRGKRV